jgi:hypothetical protein
MVRRCPCTGFVSRTEANVLPGPIGTGLIAQLVEPGGPPITIDMLIAEPSIAAPASAAGAAGPSSGTSMAGRRQ